MKVLRFLDEHGEEYLCIILIVLMSLVIGLQVVMRYIFQSSLSWSEELARYMCIWLVFIGSSYAARKGRHICVSALYDALPPKPALMLAIISDLVFLGFALVLTRYGFDVLTRIIKVAQDSPAMGVPMWMVYSALPIGFLLICVRLIQGLCLQIRKAREMSKTPAKLV